MILASIFYVLSIICFVCAYKTNVDEQKSVDFDIKTAKKRLYVLSVFILVVAIINTYLVFYDGDENSSFFKTLSASPSFFFFFLSSCCIILGFKKKWGKEGLKTYEVSRKTKVIFVLVGVLLFVLGVYLTD